MKQRPQELQLGARLEHHQHDDRDDESGREVVHPEREPIVEQRTKLSAFRGTVLREPRRELARPLRSLAAERAEDGDEDEECERGIDPAGAVADPFEVNEPEPERQHEERSGRDEQHSDPRQPKQKRDLCRSVAAAGDFERNSGDDHAADEGERSHKVEEERPVLGGGDHRARSIPVLGAGP
jgi:hypothetical protein